MTLHARMHSACSGSAGALSCQTYDESHVHINNQLRLVCTLPLSLWILESFIALIYRVAPLTVLKSGIVVELFCGNYCMTRILISNNLRPSLAPRVVFGVRMLLFASSHTPCWGTYYF